MHFLAAFLSIGIAAHANVFGVDRRVPVADSLFPRRTVGIVRQLEGERVRELCTGTLIGRRLVLTAAHCVARAGELLNPRIPTVFSNGTRSYSAVAFWSGAWRTETDPRGGDWAVLLLNAPVLSEFSELPMVAQSPQVGEPLALLGFSIDRAEGLTGDFSCQVRLALPDGVFHHDCGLFAGASGGPILSAIGEGKSRRWLIVGVQSAHKSEGTSGLHLTNYESTHANLGTSARGFFSTVQRLRAQYESLPTAKVATLSSAR